MKNVQGLFIKGINEAEAKLHMLFSTPFKKTKKNIDVRKKLMCELRSMSDERVVGWFVLSDIKRADEAIKENALDIHETNYKYVILEKVWTGIYPHTEVIQWYRWNKREQKYKPIKRPKWSKGYCNWTIG